MRSSLYIVASSAALATGLRLEARGGQTSAVCQSSFNWMENTMHDSPCNVAASVDAVCNNGQWTIGALNATVMYTNPTNSTANLCTCSWANYNLLSACIACQGFSEQIPQWTVFKSGCTADQLSETFFPAQITLPSDVAIPKWAQQDPTQWTPGEQFSVTEAQAIANMNEPDFVGGTPVTTHKKTNIGAIVGGVIGGLVVIAAGVIIALWIIRRQRKSMAPSGMYDTRPTGHMRSMSDVSTATNMKSGHGPYASLPPNGTFTNPPTSPTVLTHTSSVRSVPYMSSVAGALPYGASSPPPIARQGSSTPIQDVIEPFTLPPTVDNPDRKQSNGGYPIQVYDPPTAPPPNIMRMDSVAHTQTPSSSRRFNPPTYTESTAGRSSPRPTHREKQLSTDTQTSLASSRNAGNINHSPSHSGSGMPNIVEHMGPPPPHESYESEYGRQVGGGPSRDEKRRLQPESVNGNDLA